jgi:SulP family sulfate permease
MLHPRTLFPSITAGLISGVITIIIEVSFAAFIFSGDMSAFVEHGIGFTLFGACVLTLVTTLLSSYKGLVSLPQDVPVALLTIVAAGIAAGMPQGAAGEERYATVVFAIVIASLLTGVFFLALGALKLGRFVRYIPYPVVGGFLAGTGWLLLKGGLEVMTDLSANLSQFSGFFDIGVIVKWVPGLALACILVFCLRRLRHFAVLPVAVFIATGLFHLIARVAGVSIDEAGSRGWLLSLISEKVLWNPIPFSMLARVHWDTIRGQIGTIGIIAIISAISMLLNISGIELMSNRDMDLEHELKIAGLANLAAGLGGSPAGYHALSLTALNDRIGSKSRLAGVVAAVTCGAALLFGAGVVRIFPKFVLGGLISFVGASMLIEWVYDSWFRLSKVDYALVVLILVIIGLFGFLEGVGIGILAAMFIFIANYTRIGVIHKALSGDAQQSNVDRPSLQRRILRKYGNTLHILKLQGFIFFGTANSLYQDVRGKLRDTISSPIRFVVFDFRRVTGLDGSAEIVFIKIMRLARSVDVKLTFTGISSMFKDRFMRALSMEPGFGQVHFFPDLDHGLEWCEDQILLDRREGLERGSRSLNAFLRSIFPMAKDAKKVIRYLQRREVKPDRYLIRQGEPARHLYFIESGEFAAQLELHGNEPIRLRTMREGAMFGEIALYLNIPRSLSIVATKPSTVYQLSADDLKKMEARDPELAMAFQKYVIRLLAERLVDLNRTLEALAD